MALALRVQGIGAGLANVGLQHKGHVVEFEGDLCR
jgi:hypothetical protein